MASLILPQSLGDFGIRSYLLKYGSGASLSRAFSSSIVDRLTDLMAFCLVILPSLMVMAGAVSGSVGMAAAAAMLAAALAISPDRKLLILRGLSSRLRGAVSDLTKAHPTRWWARFLGKLEFGQEMENVGGQLNLLLVISMSRYLLMAARSYFVAAALGVALPFEMAFFGSVVVQVAMPAAQTPGGLGVLDLGWAAVLTRIGVGGEETLSFLLGQRAYVSLWTFLLFLVAHVSHFIASPRGGQTDKGGGVE
jgi:uncharacterized protein (TIRG00374 family)